MKFKLSIGESINHAVHTTHKGLRSLMALFLCYIFNRFSRMINESLASTSHASLIPYINILSLALGLIALGTILGGWPPLPMSYYNNRFRAAAHTTAGRSK